MFCLRRDAAHIEAEAVVSQRRSPLQMQLFLNGIEARDFSDYEGHTSLIAELA